VTTAMSSKSIITLWLAMFVILGCNTSNFSGSVPRRAPPPETNVKEFTQTAFPVGHKSFVQGTQGNSQQEAFEQGKWGDLDLLVVIDNSGSMDEEQANLAARMQPLLSHLEKSEWKIGVITTDPDSWGGTKFVSKSDSGASSKFARYVRAGTSGSGYERGIYQGVKGLQGGLFGGWLRDGSTVAVLIVSDEDNCAVDGDSSGNPVYDTSRTGCNTSSHQNGSYLLNHLSSIRTLGKDAKIYGLIWHPSQSKNDCPTALNKAPVYANVISQSGGTWGSICANDYSETLRRISEDISQELKYEFPLAFTPEAGTLQVLVDGQSWPHHELQGDVVKFTQPPPFGANVKVLYKHGKEGELWTSFPLDGTAVDGSFTVTVNGQRVSPSDYRYDSRFSRVVFNSPPPEGAKVVVEYKEAAQLDTDFDIGRGRKGVVVKINGRKIDGYSYDSKAGVVTVMPPPEEGSQIKIYYKKQN